MRRKTAFEAFVPTILEVYHRDEEAFWAAVMAPFLADRGSVFTWLKHLKVDVGLLSAFRGLDEEAREVLKEYSAAFGLDVSNWKSNRSQYFKVLRLYPPSYGTRNAIWESTVQNALAAEGFPVPKVHFVCTDMTILGGAFIVMDFIPGQQLLHASPQKMPEVLGETHVALHLIDPGPLIKTLKEKGIDEYEFGLDSRYDWLNAIAGELPWISDGVGWLIDNRPPEPERLAICHGDFHALNILVHQDKVTGVLDWPGFAIAAPVLDVAHTIVLTTIPARRLILSMEDSASVDWNLVAKAYLAAYRARKPLDSTKPTV